MLDSEEVQVKSIKVLVFFNYRNITAELYTSLASLEAEYLQISRSQELPPHLKRLRTYQSPSQNTEPKKTRKQFVIIDSRKVINELKDRIQILTAEISELQKGRSHSPRSVLLIPLGYIDRARTALQENKLFDALKLVDLALQENPECLHHVEDLVFPDTINFLQMITKRFINTELFDTIDASPIYHHCFEINFFTRAYIFTIESKTGLQELLNPFQSMFELVDRLQEPLLHVAARLGYSHVVNWLIDNGTPVDRVTEDGRTALMVASFHGHEALIRDLIKRKANVHHRSNIHHMALLLASQSGTLTIVQFLIQHYTDPNLLREDIDIAFHYACLGKNLSVMKCLFDRGANVNFLYNNLSPLMGACQFDHIGAVIFLIEYCRADIHLKDSNGNTALLIASCCDFPDIITFLLDHGSEINDVNLQGKTALITAVNQGHRDIVRLLLSRGATLDDIDAILITDEDLTLIHEEEANVENQRQQNAKM